MLLNITIICS